MAGEEESASRGAIYREADLHPNRRRREPELCGRRPPLADRFGHMEQYEAVTTLMRPFLHLTGLRRRGRENAERVGLRPLELGFSGLPAAFEGFRVLLLADMHFDGNPALTRAITGVLERAEADICLFGGDFRYGMYHPLEPAVAQMAAILHAVRAPQGLFGVLGNHDNWALVEPLERLGVRILVNEAVSFERQGARIWLAGVDDPHFYQADDWDRALAAVPADEFAMVLCHAPEGMEEAARRGARLFLCGHTHGGQVCFPFIGPLSHHSPVPRRFNSGLWSYNGMTGYTTPGTGSSGLFVRFNCPPEVALVVLSRRPGLPAA